MFAHEGICEQENLPLGDTERVCSVATASASFERRIAPAVTPLFMAGQKSRSRVADMLMWSYKYVEKDGPDGSDEAPTTGMTLIRAGSFGSTLYWLSRNWWFSENLILIELGFVC